MVRGDQPQHVKARKTAHTDRGRSRHTHTHTHTHLEAEGSKHVQLEQAHVRGREATRAQRDEIGKLRVLRLPPLAQRERERERERESE